MEKSVKDTFDTDRRSGNDRRKQTGINLRSMMGNGKRRLIRRLEDRNKIFLVDHYSPKLFAAIIAIIFLSVIDALLTLYLINHGAHELNPVMAYYIDVGPYTFFTLKFALTIIGAITLLIFRELISFHIEDKDPVALIDVDLDRFLFVDRHGNGHHRGVPARRPGRRNHHPL